MAEVRVLKGLEGGGGGSGEPWNTKSVYSTEHGFQSLPLLGARTMLPLAK